MIISSTVRIMIQNKTSENMIPESSQLSHRESTSISVTKLDDSLYFQFLIEWDISEIESRTIAQIIKEDQANFD